MRSNLRVHVAPVGFEVNRIVVPVLRERADKLYLITHSKNDKGSPYLEKISKILQDHKNIQVQKLTSDIWDLFDVLNKFKIILRKEVSIGSHIYVNVSTGSKVASIAGTLACMIWKGIPYYAHIDYEDKKNRNGFLEENVTQITELPVYSINKPKMESLTILRILSESNGKMKKKMLIEKLEDDGIINSNLENEAKHSKLKGLLNSMSIALDSPHVKVEYLGRQSNVIITPQGEATLKIFGDSEL